jgi:hypothetical protein
MRAILTIIICFLFTSSVFAEEGLRTMFLNNKAVICGINIRNFNSKDTNQNGLIDSNEESGNFINAIERLDEIKNSGINTLHVLPITPVGKLKALGTAAELIEKTSAKNFEDAFVSLCTDTTTGGNHNEN